MPFPRCRSGQQLAQARDGFLQLLAMELAVEKRTNRSGSKLPKSRPGVMATWARRITSRAKSQLPCTPRRWAASVQSAQA